MNISYPALTTSALFTSLLILDLSKHESNRFLFHLVFGIIAVVLMVYLSQNDADYVAWGLLLFPLLLLSIGLIIGYSNPEPGIPPTVVSEEDTSGCSLCENTPALSNTCSSTTSSPAVSSPAVCTPVVPAPAVPDPAPVTVTPTPVTSCGGAGRTQCIDTRSLTSA